MRILVLGDMGTGKSSLISSFVSRHFPEEPPDVMTDAVLPARASSSRTRVTLMDSSARSGLDRDLLKRKVGMADSIIALYDATRLDTLESLAADWLPFVVEILGGQDRARVVVVASKVDLIGEDLLPDDEAGRVAEENEKLKALQQSFPCVKSVCRCSAKLLNVDEVFYTAETIVAYPMHILYDKERGDFTPACQRALRRVFRILDQDRDNFLSDEEIQSLQEKCFGDNLDEEDLEALKKEAVARAGRLEALGPHDKKGRNLSQKGFRAFLKIFIERAMPQQLWIILRRFGYNDNHNLDIQDVSEFDPISSAPHPASNDKAFSALPELSLQATRFLVDVATCECRGDNEVSSTTSTTVGESYLQAWALEDELRKWCGVYTSRDNRVLGWHEILQIYDVLAPEEEHPWDAKNTSSLLSDGDSHFVLCGFRPGTGDAGSSRPRVPPLMAWLSQWHLLAALRPELVQTQLSMLGYVERSDTGVIAQTRDFGKRHCSRETSQDRVTMHIVVLGSNEIQKRAAVVSILAVFAGLTAVEAGAVTSSDAALPLSSSFFLTATEMARLKRGPWTEGKDASGNPILIPRDLSQATGVSSTIVRSRAANRGSDGVTSRGETASAGTGSAGGNNGDVSATIGGDNGAGTGGTDDAGVFVILTVVPQVDELGWMARFGGSVDVALQVFGDMETLMDVQERQESLPTRVSRALVCSTSDVDVQQAATHWLDQQDMLPLMSISDEAVDQSAAGLVAVALKASGSVKAVPIKLRKSPWGTGYNLAICVAICGAAGVAYTYYNPKEAKELRGRAQAAMETSFSACIGVVKSCWSSIQTPFKESAIPSVPTGAPSAVPSGQPTT